MDSRSHSPSVRHVQSSSPYSHSMEGSRYSPAAPRSMPPVPPLVNTTHGGQRSSPKQARSSPTSSHLMIPGSITRGTPVTHHQPHVPTSAHAMASMVRQPAPPAQQGSITKGMTYFLINWNIRYSLYSNLVISRSGRSRIRAQWFIQIYTLF